MNKSLPRSIYWMVRVLFTPILFILARPKISGRERLPASGGVLILANHISDIDAVYVQYACLRHICYMAKSELFEMKVVGAILRLWRAFPVRRGEPDRGSLKLAIRLLEEGQPVCIFPEGELSESGHLQALKPGVALIARSAGVPIVCLGLSGTNRILPYGRRLPRATGKPIEIRFGEPVSFDKSVPNEEVLAWAEAQLHQLSSDA